MTDLELVKFAAKAAGIEVRYQPITRRFLYQKELPSEGFYLAYWNPIIDDGDALRLAVKLNFLVDVSAIQEETEAGDGTNGYQCELHKGDPYAATRLAIVRAAAEIGKALP
jgi:hypothetical protein